jgi:hypothetical protein
MALRLQHPFPGAIVTTKFGAPNAVTGARHTGVDYAYAGKSSCYRPVYAAASGTAKKRENVGGGHGIEIDHGDGIVTGYWHLAQQLRDGKVGAGQLIGQAGATGTLVTGCHLHFELKVNGSNVDPEPYVAGTLVQGSGADSFPRDAGASCPPGYVAGTVNPQLHGWIPGSPWFGRPTNPDGTVNACIRSGLQPGDNTALTDVGEGLLGFALPLAGNLAVIGLALIVGWAGIREVLGIGGRPVVVQLLRR